MSRAWKSPQTETMCLREEEMGRRKESAYLKKEVTGWFAMSPVIRWVARDYWGNWIARAKTKKECEKKCRELNYTPRK